MVIYKCEICNFTSNIKTHYSRHLQTKKHTLNEKKQGEKKNTKHKRAQTSLKCAQTEHKACTKYTQMCTNPEKSIFFCKFCNKSFKHKQSMLRHIRLYCKEKKELDESKELKNIIMIQSKQIEKLLENQNNQINNTLNNNDNSNNKTINNIQINNYGEENLEMLTDEFKIDCVRHPYYALVRIIEKIHFNDEYPENKNIRLLNKRDNKIQIRDNGKWFYKNKEDTIRFALDDSNEKLEQFYNEKNKQFRKLIRLSCKEIIKNVQESDKELLIDLYKEMDLVLFNN